MMVYFLGFKIMERRGNFEIKIKVEEQSYSKPDTSPDILPINKNGNNNVIFHLFKNC